jgi:hypothetical protein
MYRRHTRLPYKVAVQGCRTRLPYKVAMQRLQIQSSGAIRCIATRVEGQKCPGYSLQRREQNYRYGCDGAGIALLLGYGSIASVSRGWVSLKTEGSKVYLAYPQGLSIYATKYRCVCQYTHPGMPLRHKTIIRKWHIPHGVPLLAHKMILREVMKLSQVAISSDWRRTERIRKDKRLAGQQPANIRLIMIEKSPRFGGFLCSLFPVPCSLFPVPCSLFPVPCSLFR